MKKIFATAMIILAMAGMVSCNDADKAAETTATETCIETVDTTVMSEIAVG